MLTYIDNSGVEKHYLFRSNSPIDKPSFLAAFSDLLKDGFVKFSDEYSGDMVLDALCYPEVEAVLATLRDDLGDSITVLCAHAHSDFEDRLLAKAASFFPNKVLFPSDVIMNEMSFGHFESLMALKGIFKDVPRELMLTAGSYLRSGMNACVAARSLFVHRNTFNYRLDSFIKLTGLDIRDYHNALLLELYFQFNK